MKSFSCLLLGLCAALPLSAAAADGEVLPSGVKIAHGTSDSRPAHDVDATAVFATTERVA